GGRRHDHPGPRAGRGARRGAEPGDGPGLGVLARSLEAVMGDRIALPEQGRSPDELWALMDEARASDVDWRGGRVAGYLFLGGEDVLAVAKRAYAEFSSENGLSAKAFPSLQRFESEVVAMTAGLFHGEQAVGSITGG